MGEREKLSVHVGVARIILRLLSSERAYLTTLEAAELMERARPTAYGVLTTLEASHHVPIYFDPDIGAWKILKREEGDT